MNLRNKLLFSYLVFVAALMLLGGVSAWRLREMGGVSRRIISNNYDSVVAAQDMKESLERQDSAAVFALLGAREKAMAQLREHRARFDASFKKAAGNITEAGEGESLEAIRRDRDLYYEMFDAFLAKVNATEGARSENVSQAEELSERHEYFTRLEPQFNKLRAECEHLLQLNQRAMVAKSEDAASVAQLWFYRTLLIAGFMVAAGIALAFWLANRIVEPLRQLTATTAKIAGGDLDAKAEVNSEDEVGILASEYNRMVQLVAHRVGAGQRDGRRTGHRRCSTGRTGGTRRTRRSRWPSPAPSTARDKRPVPVTKPTLVIELARVRAN
jgi:nitrogen fixation/metabolism regulation signal transduction histidine kinase